METTTKSSWPPAYNLRLSKKARHVHLKVIPHKGLEVVVPVRQQKRISVIDLLNEKKSWIEKHLSTIKILPLEAITNFKLEAINQNWQIHYNQTNSKQMRSLVSLGEANSHLLTLSGDTANVERTQRFLKKWLLQQAQMHLVPWLQALSIEHRLTVNKVSVRSQRTMWGSCTSGKNISLNYKLLFIPPSYAEHVMLHELCHTKHLNHSKRFWNLLSKMDPNCEINNQAVREADQYVPAFFT